MQMVKELTALNLIHSRINLNRHDKYFHHFSENIEMAYWFESWVRYQVQQGQLKILNWESAPVLIFSEF
jgi:hypothetical protein